MGSNNEIKAIEQLIHRLHIRYVALEASQIADIVHECHTLLANNPIRDFVPLLVEHMAGDRLREMMPIHTVESPVNSPEPTAERSRMLRVAFGDGKAWSIL